MKLSTTLILAAAGASFFFAATEPAQAHSVSPRQCSEYAQMHQFTAGKNQRGTRKRCNQKRRSHTRQHQCMNSHPRITKRFCNAQLQITTRTNQIPIAWAWNQALNELVWRESAFAKNAINKSSRACSWYQRYKCPWRISNGIVQASDTTVASNGMHNIYYRYHTPEAALQHHNKNGWY